MQSEKKSPKVIYCMIPFMEHFKNASILEKEERLVIAGS